MVDEHGRRSIGRIVKIVLFSLTPAILLLIVAETVARVSIYRLAETSADSTTGGSVYTMRIGRWPWSRRSVTRLNSLGYPDEEFPARGTKKECTHIVIVGDSYAFGDGVDGDSSFASILRRRATARKDGGCQRVFNIAVRGTTINKQSEVILQTLDRLQPDVVLLGQYQNDLTDLTKVELRTDSTKVELRGDTNRVRLPIFNVSMVKMLTYHAFAFMIGRGIERDELRHWSVMADPTRQVQARAFQETYSKHYGDLVTTLSSRGIAFGVAILPSKLDVLARRYPEEAFFLDLARKYNVPHLRLFPVFDAQRSPYPFLMYDGHLNERGNQLVADTLYDWLFETQPAPFPVLHHGPAPRPSPAQ